jgi:hypothetical protein
MMNSLYLKGIQLPRLLVAIASPIVSFEAGSLIFQIIMEKGMRPPMPFACPALSGTIRKSTNGGCMVA